MDFCTTHGTTLVIRIDGTEYKLPMFLNSAFKEKVAEYRKRLVDEALKEIPDKVARARFLMYHQPPPVDVAFMADELRSPAGVESVLRYCLKKGGVPDEVTGTLLETTPAEFLRSLSGRLTGTEVAAEGLKQNSQEPAPLKDGASPLTQGGEPTKPPPPTSDAAPTTTEQTPPSSSTPTTEATPTT